MIISVHLPKTAGTSFANSLSDYFEQPILKDYADLPLHTTSFNRNKHASCQSIINYFKNYNDIECIHGHFMPLKYRFYRNHSKETKFITWLRDPAERLASHYYYFKRCYTNEKAAKQPLLKKMHDEDWSIERFCLGPELKNTYSQFLWGFPIKHFSFIGIVEHYESDLQFLFQQFFTKQATRHETNVNSLHTHKSYFDDKNLKKVIQEFHNLDYKIYNTALERRLAER